MKSKNKKKRKTKKGEVRSPRPRRGESKGKKTKKKGIKKKNKKSRSVNNKKETTGKREKKRKGFKKKKRKPQKAGRSRSELEKEENNSELPSAGEINVDVPEGLSENSGESTEIGVETLDEPEGGITEEVPVPEKTPEPVEILGDSDLSDDFERDEESGTGLEKGEEGVERLVFSLSDEEYAVDLIGIQEIIRYVEITPVPRSGQNINGIISLRGTVIPIYDLRRRLGLDIKEVSRQTRIVIVKLEKGVVGLIVDKVSGVVSIPERAIEPPPSTSGGTSSEHLRGVVTLGDRMLILLNLEKAITLE